MNKHWKSFLQRGLVAMGGGPLVMAVVFWILNLCGVVETLTVAEMVRGIFTASLLAFVAAGVTVVYEMDRLPLIGAIGIHAAVLYLDYIGIYLLNGWLKNQLKPIAIFTACFILGFILIWLLIWLFTRNNIQSINNSIKNR